MPSLSPEDVIRQRIRRRRQLLGYGAQLRAAQQLSIHIQALESYQHSQHVAFYCAVNGEISLRPLLKAAWLHGKTCYLPAIDGERMAFVHCSPASVLENNRFGIPEPVSGGIISALDLDMVLLPLVAFDNYNHRIGMGGGFYDRTFARSVSSLARRPFLLGVAHRCQQISKVSPKPWDVAMDQVATA